MNKLMRKCLVLLVGVAIVLSVIPFATSAAKGNVIYRWNASSINADREAFASNLVRGSEADVRWNETGIIYTNRGTEKVLLHTFLNETRGLVSDAYGLPSVNGKVAENLKVDTYPMINTAGMKAVDLSFLYAYKLNEGALNPATSGLLQVYVSENGMTWSEDWVGIRSAQIVGCGESQTGEPVIYCEIHCEDLMEIDGLNAGDYIRGVRIMPDGNSGDANGTFSISEITLTGYESRVAFEAAVPAAAEIAVTMDEDTVRKLIVDTASNSAEESLLGKIADAMAVVGERVPSTERDFLNTLQATLVDGIDIKAKESITQLIAQIQEQENQLTAEKAEQVLKEYETIETTEHIVKMLNTPQQIFRAYAAAKPGDLLLRVTPTEAIVHMITGCEPKMMVDGVSVDFPNSTMRCMTASGEKTLNFTDMYITDNFVPLAVVSGPKTVSWQMDVHTNMADGVKIAAVSNLEIETCRITVGDTTVVLDDFNVTDTVYTDKRLDNTVVALADGEHEMTVTLTNGLGSTETFAFAFEKKDGKITVLSAAANHEATCQSKAMTDVDKNAWYHTAVDYALANGIMGGSNATTFGPNDTLSRAMVVQVLYNKEGQPAISGKHDFTDVPVDQWFNNAVTWGTQKGVMGGYGNGKFGPNDSVTIEQIAVILWNYAGNPAFTGNADSVGNHSGWAANALSWAVENDILEGVPFTNATENATRAQTAQMLMNYLTAN